MGPRLPGRRLVGVIGAITTVLALVFGAYGLTVGYLLEPASAAPTIPTVLTAAVVAAFVGFLSMLGSRGGGWIHTPYW